MSNDRTARTDALRNWRYAEMKYIPDTVRYWGRQRPDKVAFIDGTRTRTYAQLDMRTNRIANQLLASGVERGDSVGFIGKNSVEFFELWFATGKARCALAPFNWRLAQEELVAIVANATPRVVFASLEFAATMEAVRERCGATFEIVPFGAHEELAAWCASASDVDPALPVAGTDIALVSYTSGTTGVPKGVMASHEAFAYSFLCCALEPAMTWSADDVVLMCMPSFHLGGSWLMLAAPYQGATVSILPTFDPKTWLATLKRDHATIAPLVPAAIQVILNQPGVGKADFATLRRVMYFGSPISVEIAKRATEVFDCELQQFYGTTEVYFSTILRHTPDIVNGPRLASCGLPVPLCSMKIVDEHGAEVGPGVVGEIWVRTPMAFSGYWRRPEATDAVYRDGWYHTGDLAQTDEGGYIYIVDRLNDMIISGGENIYSTEIERALQKLPGVQTCAVVGLPDPKWGERVVAAIICAPSTSLTADGVIAHCRGLIAGYKVPKEVVFVDAMPTTPTGKVKKRALAEQLAGSR